MTDVNPRSLDRRAGWYRRLPLAERFALNWEATSSGCWQWLGQEGSRGYGSFPVDRHPQLAHRVSYTLHVGPIPDGLTLDHLCRNKLCVNPEHLEPVTQDENHRRWAQTITECANGHPFTAETTYVRPNGKRNCRTCRHAAQRRQRERQHERLRANPGAAPHGSASTYSEWGCRCEPCTEAHTSRCRAYKIGRAGLAVPSDG